MNNVELRELLAKLEEHVAKQAPVFNDRTLAKIERIKTLLEQGENEMGKPEYSTSELLQMNVSKIELFQPVPQGYDFALPQAWLDNFSKWCKQESPQVTYDLIRSTTCWDCNENRPAFKAAEVRQAYETMTS